MESRGARFSPRNRRYWDPVLKILTRDRMTSERTVIVYTREGCHLCQDAITTIRSVAESVEPPVEIELVDVDEDETLSAEYGDRVPYVVIDGRPAFKYRVDERELRQKLD